MPRQSERAINKPQPLLISPPRNGSTLNTHAVNVQYTPSKPTASASASASASARFSPSAPTPTTPASRALARPSAELTAACLLLVGVGCTLSWTAVVFGSAVYYSERYGRAALLYLSAAVYVPGVLVAAVHAALDGRMYRKLGAVRWTQLRMWAGLLLVLLFTLAIPLIPDDTSRTGELLLYALTFLLAPPVRCPPAARSTSPAACGRHYVVALTAGTQLSGPACLLLAVVTGLARRVDDRAAHRAFMLAVAACVAGALVAALVLQRRSEAWQYVMGRRDAFAGRPAPAAPATRHHEAMPLLSLQHGAERWQLTDMAAGEGAGDDEEEGGELHPIALLHSDTLHPPAPNPQLARHMGECASPLLLPVAHPRSFLSTLARVYRPALALFLTAASSVMLASLYSFAPRPGGGVGVLLLVLVYTRLTMDLVGRLVLLLPAVSKALTYSGDSGSWSGAALLAVSVCRVVVCVPLFCLYLSGCLVLSDAAVVAFVGLLSVSSGLLCTLSYQFAAVSVTAIERASAAHWMNLSFQLSILAGLIAGFIVRFTLLSQE